MEKSLLDATGKTRREVYAEETVDSVCPFCGVGCQTSVRSRTAGSSSVEGRDGPANENRLCVKGRFGFDYIHPARSA
jgi:formate dehydrogenase major subunit